MRIRNPGIHGWFPTVFKENKLNTYQKPGFDLKTFRWEANFMQNIFNIVSPNWVKNDYSLFSTGQLALIKVKRLQDDHELTCEILG